MATPMKNLLVSSSKVFSSPISPNYLSKLTIKNQATPKQRRNSRICKQLFCQERKQDNYDYLKVNQITKDTLTVPDILFNTPNKCDLLKNGIEGKKLINVIGRGAFGTVIRGVYKDSVVAIKIIENRKQSELREINALSLHHENIVKTLDVVSNSNLNYSLVLMEYYSNCLQLQQVLESNQIISQKQMLKFALDICKGLEHCHKNNILHLDIKPKNVLVTENRCKLCDFGNSVAVDKLQDYIHQGTVIYTDPSILIGKLPTKKSDIYSLGILLWQLEFRKQPYECFDNNETVIYKVVKCGLRPDSQNTSDYHDLFSKCWNSDAEQRPEIEDVLQILQTIYSVCEV